MLTASEVSSLLSEELTRIRGSTLREKLSTLPCRVGRSQGPRARPISYFLCHCLFVDRAERLGDVENRAKPVEVAHGPPTRRRRRTPTSVESASGSRAHHRPSDASRSVSGQTQRDQLRR